MADKDPLTQAKSDALKLLSFSARSSAQLAKRLKEKGYDAAVIADVLEIFKRQRLIDDNAYAEEFVRSRGVQGGSGRRKLERDLKAKGVAPAAVSQALEKYGPEEEARQALEIAERRIGAWRELPKPKQKQRLFGFLARRGFSNDAITAAFKKVFSANLDLD